MPKKIQGPGYVVVSRTAEYLDVATNEIEKAIAAGAIAIQREAKRLVNQNAGPTKTAPRRPSSAPGQPPHKRTGTLGRSIDSETIRRFPNFTGRIGTNINYGRWLELGTRRMKPRPYLRPALDAKRAAVIQAIRRAGIRMQRFGGR
jgi:HK97 gp10 family phage protein